MHSSRSEGNKKPTGGAGVRDGCLYRGVTPIDRAADQMEPTAEAAGVRRDGARRHARGLGGGVVA